MTPWCQSSYLILSRDINCLPLHTLISTPQFSNFLPLSGWWASISKLEFMEFLCPVQFVPRMRWPMVTVAVTPQCDAHGDSGSDPWVWRRTTNNDTDPRTSARVNHHYSSPAKTILYDFLVVICHFRASKNYYYLVLFRYTNLYGLEKSILYMWGHQNAHLSTKQYEVWKIVEVFVQSVFLW